MGFSISCFVGSFLLLLFCYGKPLELTWKKNNTSKTLKTSHEEISVIACVKERITVENTIAPEKKLKLTFGYDSSNAKIQNAEWPPTQMSSLVFYDVDTVDKCSWNGREIVCQCTSCECFSMGSSSKCISSQCTSSQWVSEPDTKFVTHTKRFLVIPSIGNWAMIVKLPTDGHQYTIDVNPIPDDSKSKETIHEKPVPGSSKREGTIHAKPVPGSSKREVTIHAKYIDTPAGQNCKEESSPSAQAIAKAASKPCRCVKRLYNGYEIAVECSNGNEVVANLTGKGINRLLVGGYIKMVVKYVEWFHFVYPTTKEDAKEGPGYNHNIWQLSPIVGPHIDT